MNMEDEMRCRLMKISYHKIQADGKDGRCKWEYDVNMVGGWGGGGGGDQQIQNTDKSSTNTNTSHNCLNALLCTSHTCNHHHPNTHTPKQMFQWTTQPHDVPNYGVEYIITDVLMKQYNCVK